MARRTVFMVAGIDAIGYAEIAVASLMRNCRDLVALTIITDSAEDRGRYEAMLRRIPERRQVRVVDEAECDARAARIFAAFPAVQAFRKGHPCWRKITDPTLFAEPGSEIIVLDPDLWFPNPFHFEETPPGRLLLMRQRRHCLLPPEVVAEAFRQGIPLAHHTDIGVAQHTVLPWAWIDATITALGGTSLPRKAHVESILWAAIALRTGGGYLDPVKWALWERTLPKRLAMFAGFDRPAMLRLERLGAVKCFHACGHAKAWLVPGVESGLLRDGAPQLAPTAVRPFQELTPAAYARGERLKEPYRAALRMLRIGDPFAGRPQAG